MRLYQRTPSCFTKHSILTFISQERNAYWLKLMAITHWRAEKVKDYILVSFGAETKIDDEGIE